MTIDKALTVDLNRVQPHKVIKIHEGDVNSVFLMLTVTKDGEAVSLSGLTIKYDATIAGFLAEQDANGSVSNGKIRIPITSNMTAIPGTLKIDVRMKSGTEVLYTQTVTMIVAKSVVDNSTIIDFDGTTIGGRLNELEASMLDVKTIVRQLNAKFPIEADDIKENEVIKVKGISSSAVDTAVNNYIAYGVSLDGRSNILFCVNSGSNLRTQYRFDTLGFIKYRSQTKNGSTGEWNDWSNWTPFASNQNIADGAVSTSKLADNAVSTAKIANSAVTADKLASNAVTGAKIENGAIQTRHLSDGCVETDAINNEAVTSVELANGAVTEAKLADGAVTSDKIANGAVTLNKIPDEEITGNKLAPGAVTTAKIEYNAVTADEIADGAVTAAKIASGVIPTKTSDLQNDSGFVSDLSEYMKRITSIVPSEGGQFYFDRTGLSLTDVNLYATLYSGAGSKRVAWFEDLPNISALMALAPNVNTPPEIEALSTGQMFTSQGNIALKTTDGYIILAKSSDYYSKSQVYTKDEIDGVYMELAPDTNPGSISVLEDGH